MNSPGGDREFLGRGWAFPPMFTGGGAEVAMVAEAEDIRQSLEILLSTAAAERLLAHDFGCDLSPFQFQEVDSGLLARISELIADAILVHETRVTLNAVDVSPSAAESGQLVIRVDYTIRASNSRYNLVFPFYVNEASPRALL